VKRLAHPNRVVFGAVVTSLAGMIQKSLHAGHEPMARTMPGRQTPSLEYRAEPLHRTRSEILEERRQKLRAHSSYDLDGDGFVRCAVDTAPHRTTPRGCVRLPLFWSCLRRGGLSLRCWSHVSSRVAVCASRCAGRPDRALHQLDAGCEQGRRAVGGGEKERRRCH
jgi:hypothetical protein